MFKRLVECLKNWIKGLLTITVRVRIEIEQKADETKDYATEAVEEIRVDGFQIEDVKFHQLGKSTGLKIQTLIKK